MITAERVYKELVEMPLREREKLFAAIAAKGFEKDAYQHEEVFEEVYRAPFTLREAAEYLEMAEITVRRWVQQGRLNARRLGKNIVFDPHELKTFKQK